MEGGLYLVKAVLPPLFMLLVYYSTHMSSCSASRTTPSKADIQFIKMSCHTTSSPRVCTNTLLGYAAKIHSSPKIAAETALSIAYASAVSTAAAITKLSKTQGLTPREAGALRDCVEVLEDSVDDLQMSVKEMNYPETRSFGLRMSNVQTWVSAALTNEDTCKDGFDGDAMNGKVKSKVKDYIHDVEEMTSIALALINDYAAGQTTSP